MSRDKRIGFLGTAVGLALASLLGAYAGDVIYAWVLGSMALICWAIAVMSGVEGHRSMPPTANRPHLQALPNACRHGKPWSQVCHDCSESFAASIGR